MTGTELRVALEELGISNADFHRMTGFHEQTISRWCCGRLRVPQHVALIIELLRERRAAQPSSARRDLLLLSTEV
jgi:DNA-binding transcriptional regulator YiaG